MIWPCDRAVALRNARWLQLLAEDLPKNQPTEMGRTTEHLSLHQGLWAVMVDRKRVVICFHGVAISKCPSSNK